MKTKNCRTRKLIAGVSVCLLAVSALVAHAQTNDADKSSLRRWMEGDYMFGDWGGLRTKLREEHGVDFEFMYAASVPTALSGGIDAGSEYEGALLMMLNVDTEKAGLWPNGSFRASSLYLHSTDEFSANHVGDLNRVSLLDFPDTFRLWELFYEHKFLDGKVSLKAGQLDIGMDFIVPEFYSSIGQLNFLNQTFFFPTMAFNVYDQPFFPVGNHALASTPYAAPGALLKVNFCPEFYAQFGAYDGNPDRSFSGTDFHLDKDEGALLYFEMGFKHNQGKEDTGLPGNIKLGGWYHTDDFFDMHDGSYVAFDNFSQQFPELGGFKLSQVLAANSIPVPTAFTNPRTRDGNYGLYFLADHYLWFEKDKSDPAQQGLVGFFRASYAPPDRNLAQLGLDGGLVYKGPIPGRDWDALSVGFSYLEISDDLRHAQDELRGILDFLSPGAGALVPKADYEAVIEMNYKLQVAAWCAVDTSVQRVFHPGGRVASNTPDAWVLIVQSTFRF